MGVNRCICHKISFSEVKRIAEERNLTTVEEISDQNIACTNCKLCLPYIELMLETGETEFSRGAVRFSKR
ncbi:(2Fe-2S)-binding protein [Rhodohalobacter halophilus]|uniref:(2Fe-2S)-binding protein n=1 Tax=Rhodohalobacter halophilus TaxID=1812810 RepID=UPI00083F59D1|nr:(2Fe-2S)-binding protein [Rhodohalobacter halophilus]